MIGLLLKVPSTIPSRCFAKPGRSNLGITLHGMHDSYLWRLQRLVADEILRMRSA
jgi:hypothetical protein